MDKLNLHNLSDEEHLNNVKKQIKLMASGFNFLLWPVSLIMTIATKFFNNDLLFIATLIILCLMIFRILKLAKLVKIIYYIYYLDGPYPPQKKYAFITNYILNIPLIIFCIYSLISGKYFWIIIPSIVVSFLLFLIMAVLHASSIENH